MKLNEIDESLRKYVNELEEARFYYEEVLTPRYRADMEILSKCKEYRLKVGALLDKSKKGEKVTQEDLENAVPKAFR